MESKVNKGSNKESKIKDEKKERKTTANTSEKDMKMEEDRLKKEENFGEEEEENDKSPATMEAVSVEVHVKASQQWGTFGKSLLPDVTGIDAVQTPVNKTCVG